MSRYTPIWDRLKHTRKCELAVPLSHHRRVIKAVIREKDRDVLFKFESSQKFKRYRIKYQIEGCKVTFILLEYLNLTGNTITAGEL